MRRFHTSYKTNDSLGKKGQTIVDQWIRYRKGLYSCLLWWIIGAGIGLLFAIALDSEMKQALAQHLENGVSYLLHENSPPFTYFLKRCLTYTQLLLLIWGLEYFTYGYMGVRILMLCRGFIYGFSQMAWAIAYGVKGILLGLVAYCPHNLLFAAVAAWLEWLLRKNAVGGRLTMRQVALWLCCFIPLMAWVEAYGASALFRACM